jgi:hypothetical protein
VIGRVWNSFTHPVARAGAIIALALMVILPGATLVSSIQLFTAELPDVGIPLPELSGSQLRQAIAVSVSATLSSFTYGLHLLFAAIILECAARFARHAGDFRIAGVRAFFSNGLARLFAMLSALYLLAWILITGLNPAGNLAVSVIFSFSSMLTFAAPLMILAVLVEYLSRIADALDKPGALGVDEGG